MKPAEQEGLYGRIDIKAILQKIAAKWYYFLVSIAILIPVACGYIYLTQNVYLVRASILLNGEVKNGLNAQGFLKGMELLTKQTALEDEIGILRSYSLAKSTIQKIPFGLSYFATSNFRSYELALAECPFQITLDSTINQLVDTRIDIGRISDSTYLITVDAEDAATYNFYTNTEGGKTNVTIENLTLSVDEPYLSKNLGFKIKFKEDYYTPTDTRFYFIINNLNSLSDFYRNQLEVKPVSRESNLVEVTLETRNPEKGIVFLNKLLEVYRTNELVKKNELGLKTILFIDDQLGGVSNELRQAESSLEQFRSRNNILDISTTAENLTNNLDKLELNKSLLSQKLKYYRYIAASLTKENDIKNIDAPSTFGIEDPILNNLLMELTRLNQERIGLNYSTKENNPVAEVIELKIASVKKALVANVSNFIEATNSALNDITTQIYDVRRNVQGLPRSERELVNIKRQFDFNDNLYNYLLEKKAEAGIAIASNTIEKTIIDHAKVDGPGPIAPNKKVILLLTALLGIGLSLGVIVMKDVLNDNIITPQDLEMNTNIPFIGIITHGNKSERGSVIVANAKSAIGESFRSLRVNLQYLTLGSETNVIGITSSVESEGKTFCSVNLAVAMAQSGKRTIIIECDLRRPKIAHSFRINSDKGLSSYLIGRCQLKEIISSTGIKGLDTITSGPIPPNPLDLIGLPKLEEMIHVLKTSYNTIILDSPPIGFVSEYIILMRYTNANLYVVRSNYTNKYLLDKINRLFDESKIKNVSVLLNDFKSTANRYNYVYG